MMIIVNKYTLLFLFGCFIQYIDAGASCEYYPNYPDKSNTKIANCNFLCCNTKDAKNVEQACCNTAWTIGLSVGGVALLILIICVISVVLCCCGIACSCLECLLCPCKMCC